MVDDNFTAVELDKIREFKRAGNKDDAKEYGVKSLEVLHQKIWTEVQNNWKIMGGSGEPYINPEHIKKAEQFINSEQYSNLVYAHFSKDKADALINFSRNYGLNFLKNHEVKK
jgi:hypothetical protein